MSGTDPNIYQNDQHGCLSIDTQKPSPYWLSPNVIMTTEPNDPSDIYPGAINVSQVSVSWQENCTVTAEVQPPTIVLDLFVGDPFLGGISESSGYNIAFETNRNSSGATVPANFQVNITAGQINLPVRVPPSIQNQPDTFWDSANIPTLSQPHHACLLARVYPFGTSADPGDLMGYPPTDLHYAQHNCTVDTVDGQGMIRIPITNGTSKREPELVFIQAVPDLNPNKTVLDAVLPSLKRHPAFKKIATTPLRHVAFDVSAFKSHHESLLDKIEDWIEKEAREIIEDLEGKCHKAQGATARVALPPGLIAKFDLILDMTGAAPGDAYVCHVSQVNGKAEPLGGVTVVRMVA
jgi:hypothetical protein